MRAPCTCALCALGAGGAKLSDAAQAALVLGNHAPAHFTADVVAHVVSKYPDPFRQFEAAIGIAAQMGWSGRHQLAVRAGVADA